MKRLGGPELKLPDLDALRDRLSGLRPGRPSGGGKVAKLSEHIKAPPFLVDLYWDLRDRHLLPLVALAVVACIAAPILLGGSGKSDAPASGSAAGSPNEGVEGGGRSLAVAEAEPGLREPSKRLRGRRAQDPFRQRSAGGAHEGSASESGGGGQATPSSGGGSEGATTIATTTTSQPAPVAPTESSGGASPGGAPVGGAGPSTPGNGAGGSETGSAEQSPGSAPSPKPSGPEAGNGAGGGNGSGGGNGGGSGSGSGGGGNSGSEGGSGPGGAQQVQLFTFAIDVKITKTTTEANGAKSKPEVIEKERVLPSSALPYKKSQVVTYMGIGPTTRQPLFLVSEAVGSVFGEAKCVAGEQRCQLVELEKGFPVTFVYGENDVRYKVQVLKIEPVAIGHS